MGGEGVAGDDVTALPLAYIGFTLTVIAALIVALAVLLRG